MLRSRIQGTGSCSSFLAFAIGTVAGEVARAEIREAVAAEGRRDGVDFVAVA